MGVVYLLTGSNQGDKSKLLAKAKEMLTDFVDIITFSGIYESDAWGLEDQPPFYNQVIIGSTVLSPDILLKKILDTEIIIGRVKKVKWGQRLIDIDILYYDDLIVNRPGLIIPHPYIQERRFTLMPLAELVPGKEHPVFRKTQAQLLEYCKDVLKVRLIT
ncbi:MAG: 2-amino-4-hydroxy-6-hydroxymethyldihydropteridine diphosphokinase [Cyclobacteriaceae bacterium]